jgi:hypothetical protein
MFSYAMNAENSPTSPRVRPIARVVCDEAVTVNRPDLTPKSQPSDDDD